MKTAPERSPGGDRPRTSPHEGAPRPERAPVPVVGARGLSRQTVQLLQGTAGNAAVARLVAQRYAAPVEVPASAAPGMRRVGADVAAKQQRLSHHQPAVTESKSAQDAAVAPPDDREAQGKVANADRMNAARPGTFDKSAFIRAVNDAIAAQAPKNLDEADKFSSSGRAEKIKGAVDGKVVDGKQASTHDIDTATKAPPDVAAAKDKQVVPMRPDQPPANPGAPNAADAAPQPQPAAVTDFSDGPRKTDQQMADADVTEHQLAAGNEPAFTGALRDKAQAEHHSAVAPGQARGVEKQQIAAARSGAAAAGVHAMAGLTATRAGAGKAVDGGKGQAKSKDEQKRVEVTARLQKVFDATKRDVEAVLSGLDKKVDRQFTAGEQKARAAFEADQKRRMKAYKDKRYGGVFGGAKWAKDKLLGMPKAADDLYQYSRQLYVAQMQQVISTIADTIGTELGRAKARIARGRADLKAEVAGLPADLRRYGQEAAKGFADRFDDLETEVADKSKQLVQDLATKYTQALHKVDDEIRKLQAANKGLVDKAVDAVADVVKTIIELKNLLMGVLAKAAGAIGKIIKNPIGFLNNLVRAVGAGLRLFVANIADHLKKGLVSWLLGTAVKAGLALPAAFDLKGIIRLVSSLLGLTWANIRARITRKGLPEEAVGAVEKAVPIAGKLSREGPVGAEKEIVAEVGDVRAGILGKLTAYLVPTVVVAGITWILSLLNPASAFVRAVKGIVDVVTFVVTQGAQVLDFVNAVLDAVVAIADGGTAGVPKLVEAALAASIPAVLGFLASLLGVEGLAGKVKQVFQSVARPVNRVIDRVVDGIVRAGRKIWSKLRGKRSDRRGADNGETSRSDKKKDLPAAVRQAKAIIAKNEKENSSVDAVTTELRTLRNKYPWIKDFTAEKEGAGYGIAMKASDHPLRHYYDIESVKQQLKKYGSGFVGKVHYRWLDRQLKRPKTDAGRIWEDDVLHGTDSGVLDYMAQDDTAAHVKSSFYDNTRKSINSDAFEGHVFGVGSDFRRHIVKDLGESALPPIKSRGESAAADNSELLEIIQAMDFLSEGDAYGKFVPFPAGAEEREHTNYRPVSIHTKEYADRRISVVRTEAGKIFVVTESDPKRSMKLSVHGFDLRLKESGDPRGVTQDSPGMIRNQSLNRAHVIADWFGGSGYKKALNLVTTSDHYNKVVMGQAEKQIAEEVVLFAAQRGVKYSQISMNLRVAVSFGDPLEDVFKRNIENQSWYRKGDQASENELARLMKILNELPARHVTGVVYRYKLSAVDSGVSISPSPIEIRSDDRLFVERNAD